MTPDEWLLAEFERRMTDNESRYAGVVPTVAVTTISGAASWPEPRTVDRLPEETPA